MLQRQTLPTAFHCGCMLLGKNLFVSVPLNKIGCFARVAAWCSMIVDCFSSELDSALSSMFDFQTSCSNCTALWCIVHGACYGAHVDTALCRLNRGLWFERDHRLSQQLWLKNCWVLSSLKRLWEEAVDVLMYLNLWEVQRWFFHCIFGFLRFSGKILYTIIVTANQLQSCEASLGLFHAGVEVWGQARIGSFFRLDWIFTRGIFLCVTSRTKHRPGWPDDVKNHEKTDARWWNDKRI